MSATEPQTTVHATLAVLPGDGVGPEVVAEGVRVLEAVARRYGHTFELREGAIGGTAIDATGNALPEATRAIARGCDAVLLGAVGGPKWDDPGARVRPEQGLLGVRKLLGTYANLRPVRLFDAVRDRSPIKAERLAGVDLVVVRELTGGLYFGDKRRWFDDAGVEFASESCTYSVPEIERVVRSAATLARQRRGRLASVDKANVMETSRLWREVTSRVMREEFPDVQVEHVLVDACAMYLIRDPARFDVIVTENLFGDILTDEASVLAGSIGLLPSASLGAPGRGGRPVALYEPIHGSAPDIAGTGRANPIGMILSVAMMLDWSFGLGEEARAVERAVEETIAAGVLTPDLGGEATTGRVGEEVAGRVG